MPINITIKIDGGGRLLRVVSVLPLPRFLLVYSLSLRAPLSPWMPARRWRPARVRNKGGRVGCAELKRADGLRLRHSSNFTTVPRTWGETSSNFSASRVLPGNSAADRVSRRPGMLTGPWL